ncbi:ergothioneine biosynthesis protein EgtB [soil metagenome]
MSMTAGNINASSDARTWTDPDAGALARRYREVRQRSLDLAAPLSAEDAQIQSMPDASPTKWHLAHITWFFETFILERFEDSFQAFDPAFRVLFNSYYKGVGAQHPRAQRGLVSRPSLDVVKRYRANVDERVQALLEKHSSDGLPAELSELIVLGLHHEQQHQELLLTDIKHALWHSPLQSGYARRWPMAPVQPEPLRWFDYEGGLVQIGHDPALDGDFCFDNETPRHREWLEPYQLASRPVTYGEYLDFMNDDGYGRSELWLSLGWDWVQSGHREAPLYWSRAEDGQWINHTLQGVVPIDPHSPVCHLSYFEADAFARWSDARLPTEAEWEHAARQLDDTPFQLSGLSAAAGGSAGLPSGSPGAANLADRGAYHPLPQPGTSGGQPLQMLGDVWEWTSSSYDAYPGYKPLPGAVGEYNGKFMCSQLVLRGGSCVTPAGHLRASYRNFFPPDAQWQFSGLRLARDRS